MPIRRIPCQPGNFQAQHDTGFAQAHLRNQSLKALPIDSRWAGLSQIAVDDDDVLNGPAQGNGMLAQSVLPLRAFGIFEHLAKRGLADVKIGIPLQVPGIHFLVCKVNHGVASCCRERIMLASRLVNCDRISRGMVSWPLKTERVSGSTSPTHSDQASIQAVMPRRRKRARPKPWPPEGDLPIASLRSCS
jgi:hypothetical protein